MHTGRSVTSQAKKHPIASSSKAQSKPSSNKIFSQVESLHIQLIQSPPREQEMEYFRHKIQEYRTKLMKTEPLKKTKKYFQKLQECETIINTKTSDRRPSSSYTISSKPTSTENFSLSSPFQHTRTDSGCQNSRYNSIQMDLLRSTVQSKEGLLKQLYQKQKLKVQTYQEVIKQQQREMNLVKDRLQEVEVNKSTSNIYSNMTHTISRSQNIDIRDIQRRHKSNHSKESQSKSYNKENVQSNSNNQNIFRQSNNSMIKELILKNNQQSLSFEKTEKCSRVSSKLQDNVSKISSGNSYESTLLKQQEDLIVSLQHQNRILTTSKQTLEISLSNKDKTLKSKEKQLEVKAKEIIELKEQIRVKQDMLAELLYEKQNYSYAYVNLKQQAQELRTMLKQNQDLKQQASSNSISQKTQQFSHNQELKIKQQQMGELEEIIVQTKTDLEQERERNEGLKVALGKEQEKVRKITQRWNDSEEENKQVKLKLRTMEHKMEMYMEKFYKLQNECIMESRHKSSSGRCPRDSKSFSKTEKLYTAHTYEISCDRQLDNERGKERSMRQYPRDIEETKYTDRAKGKEREKQRERDLYTDRQRETNRKREVLSQIKSMVRDRRNHLFQ